MQDVFMLQIRLSFNLLNLCIINAYCNYLLHLLTYFPLRNRPKTKRNGAKKHRDIKSKTLESDQAVPDKSGIMLYIGDVQIKEVCEISCL